MRKNHIIVLDLTTATPITTLLILSFVLVFLSYTSGQENQTANAQATTTSAGGDANVLYAGSLISVTETKVGPAFGH
jgi:uncharacterized membrane protein YkvI